MAGFGGKNIPGTVNNGAGIKKVSQNGTYTTKYRSAIESAH
jgi:hypothetical protein